MLKRYLAVIFVVAFAISFIGCGVKNFIGTKPVPTLDGYSKVLIAPFDIKKPTGKFEDLPTMLSYGAGTRLGIKLPDKTWNYDQSREVKPVANKVKELGLTSKKLYEEPESAVTLAKAFDSDLIVVGSFKEPNYTIERSGKVDYDMSKTSVLGAARYYTVRQTAKLRVNVKIIEVSSGKMLWQGDILGYKNYATKYKTQESEKIVREETMYADIRKVFVDIFIAKLYPSTVAPVNK
jgi:hypothetical protein